ncbi:hypothetical protein SDC9_117973 [bioreactor metagenome]|uniref:Uncharacterized protein n=1 Tax=bioreactor metagenome TaxID=1076179 RepID=A0A645BZR5_9ZZZZ
MSFLDIASSLQILPLPQAVFKIVTPSTSIFIPTSKGKTSVLLDLDKRHTLERPFAMFPATIAVTPLPDCETPSSTTPLSLHITAIAFLRSVKSAVDLIPAILINIFSNLPKPSIGFPILSQRIFALSIAAISIFFILFKTSKSFVSSTIICYPPAIFYRQYKSRSAFCFLPAKRNEENLRKASP